MKSKIAILFAIFLLVSYIRCEGDEEKEEERQKTMKGTYELSKIISDEPNVPKLEEDRLELMIITHKDNENEINYSLRGSNTWTGVIKKDGNDYKVVQGSSILKEDGQFDQELFIEQIILQLKEIKYDEKTDQLTITSPKGTLIFDKL